MTTFTLTARSIRSGLLTTPSFLVPNGFTTWAVRTDMSATDLVNPAKSLTLDLQASTDGGTTWLDFAGFAWTGVAGINPRTGAAFPNPTLSGNWADLVGKRVRAVVTLATSIDTGFVVDIT